MGLIIAWYKSSLFSVVSLDFLPISQYICRSLRLIWLFFAVMCGLHVNFCSSIRPRYFTSFFTGNCVPFIVTTVQSVLRFVNVICADLVSLTFTRQLLSQVSSWLKCASSWMFYLNTISCLWNVVLFNVKPFGNITAHERCNPQVSCWQILRTNILLWPVKTFNLIDKYQRFGRNWFIHYQVLSWLYPFTKLHGSKLFTPVMLEDLKCHTVILYLKVHYVRKEVLDFSPQRWTCTYQISPKHV
jgi:hypothetical protein